MVLKAETMVEVKYNERAENTFKARVRYLGASLIVTIPMRVRRELKLKHGDIISVHVSLTHDDRLRERVIISK